MELLVGVISDTHGLLRPEAVQALGGSQLIIHAGDVGDPLILDRLREIAPVFAVRGNVDKGKWAEELPVTCVVEVAGKNLYVLHDEKQLDLNPRVAGFSAVISGHSHKPLVDEKNGVLFLNPGSAGPRRFQLPVILARVHIRSEQLHVEIVRLV